MDRYQRGALSLWWCAILVGLCTGLAFVGIFSVQHGRNLFADGWAYVQNTPAGQSMQRTQFAATSVLKEHDTTLRKCTINGAVVYSNVDCRPDNPTSRVVELHDSRGFEPPKVPVVAKPQTNPSDNLQQKALDKAIENATGN
jgi:hypothetical protein